MTLKIRRNLTFAGISAMVKAWTSGRSAEAARAAARLRDGGSDWRPCPGAYALLAGIHRD